MTTPDVRVIVTDEERCALPCDTRRSRQSCRRDLRKGSGDAAVITSHLRALLVHAGRGAGASGAAAGRGPGTAPAGARFVGPLPADRSVVRRRGTHAGHPAQRSHRCRQDGSGRRLAARPAAGHRMLVAHPRHRRRRPGHLLELADRGTRRHRGRTRRPGSPRNERAGDGVHRAVPGRAASRDAHPGRGVRRQHGRPHRPEHRRRAGRTRPAHRRPVEVGAVRRRRSAAAPGRVPTHRPADRDPGRGTGVHRRGDARCCQAWAHQ